jgi:hypothetical protein
MHRLLELFFLTPSLNRANLAFDRVSLDAIASSS